MNKKQDTIVALYFSNLVYKHWKDKPHWGNKEKFLQKFSKKITKEYIKLRNFGKLYRAIFLSLKNNYDK